MSIELCVKLQDFIITLHSLKELNDQVLVKIWLNKHLAHI